MILHLGIVATAALAPHHLFSRLYDVEPYRQLLRDWMADLALEPASTILEVGCGPGRLCLDLRSDGFQVCGADRSPRMIRAARRNGLDRSQAIFGDALHLPFEEGRFDAAVSASLINVVDDAPKLLAEMARVTRPGGTISCLFPTPTFRDLGLGTCQLAYSLGFVDRELLKTWASLSRKLEAETVLGWMSDVGLRDLTVQPSWGGRIQSVSGKRRPLERVETILRRA